MFYIIDEVDEFLKLVHCHQYRLMSGHLLDMNAITILSYSHSTSFFPSYCRESDFKRLQDGTGRRTKGNLHCICSGLQQSSQERPKSLCAWAKV